MSNQGNALALLNRRRAMMEGAVIYPYFVVRWTDVDGVSTRSFYATWSEVESFLTDNVSIIKDLSIDGRGVDVSEIPTSLYGWPMTGSTTIETMDLSNLFYSDTLSAVTIREVAAYCTNLRSFKGGVINTTSLSLYTAFTGCSSLEFLSIKVIATGSFTLNLYQCFSGCKKLPNMDFSDWEIDVPVYLLNTFNYCTTMTEIDLGSLSSSYSGLISFCSQCSSLQSIDLTPLAGLSGNISFYGCSSLKIIDFLDITITNGSYLNMFHGCTSLEEVIFDNATLAPATNLQWVFNNCSSLKIIDFSRLDVSGLYGTTQYNPFYGCTAVEVAYARNQEDADYLNEQIPSAYTWRFVVKDS